MQIQYKGNNLDLQAGDVVMFRNNLMITEPLTFLSLAVRAFTQFEFNHSAVVVNNQGLPFISEAIMSGIVSRPAQLHMERSKTRIMVIRPKTPVDEFLFTVRANSKLGTKYDFENLFIHQPIFRTTGKWIGPTYDHAQKRMVCSEFIAWAHQLPNWWNASTKEIFTSGKFYPIFKE
jgi:hypothetical protein